MIDLDKHYEERKATMKCPKCGMGNEFGLGEGWNPTLVEWYSSDCACNVWWEEKVGTNNYIKRRHRAIIKAQEQTYYHLRQQKKTKNNL